MALDQGCAIGVIVSQIPMMVGTAAAEVVAGPVKASLGTRRRKRGVGHSREQRVLQEVTCRR